MLDKYPLFIEKRLGNARKAIFHLCYDKEMLKIVTLRWQSESNPTKLKNVTELGEKSDPV